MYFISIGFLAFCTICIVLGHGEEDLCQSPYSRIGNGCYFISTEKGSADAAFALCLKKGGYLANFETLDEAMLMKAYLKETYSGVDLFVGGRNIDRYIPGGDWRWIKHGQMVKMEYKAFMPGMPNGSLTAPQDCVAFFSSHDYSLNDVPCDHRHSGGYICEK